MQALQDEVEEKLAVLSTAELTALALSAAKNDEPKASTQINEKLNSVKNPLIELSEKLKERKQNLETAKEHLNLYRIQLQPVEEVFSQVEVCAAEEAPVSLEEEELGKVDVSCQWAFPFEREFGKGKRHFLGGFLG